VRVLVFAGRIAESGGGKSGGPVAGGIDEDVGLFFWRGGGEGVVAEAEGAAYAPDAGVAGGLKIDLAVADHGSFFCADADLIHEGAESERIGLFEGEAVSTVDVEEVIGEAEALADAASGADGLVGEDSHDARGGRGGGIGGVELVKSVEGVEDAFIGVGEVELVGTIVVEEKFVGAGLQSCVDLVDQNAVGCREGAAKEHGRAVADETGDDRVFKVGAADVLEGGVDAVAEILSRIDEGAVEIEDEKPEALDRDRAKDVDHDSSVGGARVQGPGGRGSAIGEQGTGEGACSLRPVRVFGYGMVMAVWAVARPMVLTAICV